MGETEVSNTVDILFQDWINLILRWAHLITGIAWIGSSFYFVWLDLSLRKRPGMDEGVYGEAWMVHGGGFYHVNKWMVAPSSMPPELHWFKYEAYFTWITGFALLVTGAASAAANRYCIATAFPAPIHAQAIHSSQKFE
jgi:uncharacterized membrane protein